MKRMIIMGSPRAAGRSAHLAEMLFEACIDECPDDELSLAPVSELDIAGCIGCGACEHSEGHTCIIDDDMTEIREIMDEADELTVVSPVYFSGAPSQFKALLDRFQPYFWTWERGGARRPMTLHVIGEGGDPNGYEALISEVRSAGAVAGFRLERVVDWVGKIDESGEITAEGTEYVPRDQAVQYARIAAEDIEDVHVLHDQNVRRARKERKAAGAQGGASDAAKQVPVEQGASANVSADDANRTATAEKQQASAAARPQLSLYGNAKKPSPSNAARNNAGRSGGSNARGAAKNGAGGSSKGSSKGSKGKRRG